MPFAGDRLGLYGYLSPAVGCYAPRGLTPMLNEHLSHDHLATIGAITSKGQLFFRTSKQAISSRHTIACLDWLQRAIPGRLLILRDGSPTHRSKPVQAYLAHGAAKRIHLEPFPGYAPELNPIEWIWSYMRVVQLANVAGDSLPEFNRQVRNAKRRLQRRPELIKAFIQHVDYNL